MVNSVHTAVQCTAFRNTHDNIHMSLLILHCILLFCSLFLRHPSSASVVGALSTVYCGGVPINCCVSFRVFDSSLSDPESCPVGDLNCGVQGVVTVSIWFRRASCIMHAVNLAKPTAT